MRKQESIINIGDFEMRKSRKLLTAILVALMCLLVLPEVKAQDSFLDSTYDQRDYSMMGLYEPAHSIIISSPSGKELNMDFEGDTLMVYGDLQLDSAAIIFIRELVERYSTRIGELRNEIAILKGKN